MPVEVMPSFSCLATDGLLQMSHLGVYKVGAVLTVMVEKKWILLWESVYLQTIVQLCFHMQTIEPSTVNCQVKIFFIFVIRSPQGHPVPAESLVISTKKVFFKKHSYDPNKSGMFGKFC